MSTTNEKVLLIILDGYGKAPCGPGNAIELADTPTLDFLEKHNAKVLLKADSEAVGLPANTMGGSEVGHYTIGAGKVIMQSLPMINQQIEDGTFFQNKALLDAVSHVKTNNSCLHLIGMISDAGVHSHLEHLGALLKLAQQEKVEKVYIHAIADGRDVPERSVIKYLKRIQELISEHKVGKITDLIGRFYAMDRDNNWQRTESAFKLYTDPNFAHESLKNSTEEALTDFYTTSKESDYYLTANKIDSANEGLITGEDSVIFFNYRTDRAQQLTDAFTKNEFTHFKRDLKKLPFFVCFGEYSQVAAVAFPADKAEHNLASHLSSLGLKQLRIAETEKYPHVTFFFNSQNKEPYKNEERILIPSPKVPSYCEKPEMSAPEITEVLIPEIKKENYDLIVTNFANLDLVGHSGNLEATIKATEVVDQCLSKILPLAKEHKYHIVITGDHGNADEMLYEDGSPCPSHSMNPTQCIIIPFDDRQLNVVNELRGLQDIAPTVLKLMNIDVPTTMTGTPLFK